MNVAVVIPAYNQGRYLRAALDSVLGQTREPDQVIVVDDGSTDDTPEVCARYADRITYLRQDNGGSSPARNAGAARADAEAVLFLDADDVLRPDWLERALPALEAALGRGERVAAVHGDYVLFDDTETYRKRVPVRQVNVSVLLRCSPLSTSGALVTMECLRAVGDFDPALSVSEDWDFWLRAAMDGYRFVRVPVVAYDRRDHAESMTKARTSLEKQVVALSKWLNSDRLTAEEKAVISRELARVYLRIRRAAYFAGDDVGGFVRQAVTLDPTLAQDPWLCVYGAVYLAPFFRNQSEPDRVGAAIETLEHEVREHMGPGTDGTSATGKLRARARLAMALDQVLRRHYIRAAELVGAAVRADPTLAWRILSAVAHLVLGRMDVLPIRALEMPAPRRPRRAHIAGSDPFHD